MSSLDQAFWLALFRALTVEVGGVVLVAMLVNRAIRSAFWRRALWQATVICLLLLTASELSGFGRGIAALGLRPRVGQRQEMAKAPATPSGVSFEAKPSAVIFLPRPAAPPVIWWPAFLWLAGLLVVLARVAVAQLFFAVLRRRWPEIVNRDLNRRVAAMLGQLGCRRRILLLQASSLASPIAFGIVRPAIALPPDFAVRFNVGIQEAVLAHELAHLAARDPLWYLLADMASALLWWHPLAWWARRQLHRHCELAADQATAIVPDGPVRLAQCLVRLGREMTGQRKWGLMGVNGGGFGSNLGERVESLVKLADGTGTPRRGWRVAALKAGGTIMLAGLVVCLCGWAEGPSVFEESWHDSAASAFLMAALDTNHSSAPVPNPDVGKQKSEDAAKIQNAKLLYERGKYDAAETLLVEILKADPSNKTAPYYLDLIKEARYAAHEKEFRFRASQTPSPTPNATNSPSRQNILFKLEHIRFDEVNYRDLPLNEVLEQLRVESQKRDRGGVGVNLMFAQQAEATNGAPSAQVDENDITINIDHPLHDVRLVDVLDTITKVAKCPLTISGIKFTIEDYAVVFSPKVGEDKALYTRVFKVDPTTFLRGLTNVTSALKDPPGVQVLSAADTRLRAYFTAAGADLSAQGKVIFFNDRLGELLVRASRKDFEIIEQAVALLNQSPPQVTIDARFVEVNQATLPGLPLGWTKPASKFDGIMTEAKYRSTLAAIKKCAGADLIATPKITTLSGHRACISSTNGNSGMTLDVLAEVGPDGYSIDITAIPSVKVGEETWQNSASHKLWDGNTLLIGGVMTNQLSGANKWWMVFVTAIIIDPAGNRVHADDDMPFTRNSIPPQPPTAPP